MAIENAKKIENPILDETAMYLFNQGVNYESYRMLGAHPMTDNVGQKGYFFAVWAPNAKSVSVVCDRNGWDRTRGFMHRHPSSGIWEAFLPGIGEGEKYKFCIETNQGELLLKADPYAFMAEVRPATASVTTRLDYKWKDKKWMREREKISLYDKPVNIYEMHFGSWKQKEDGSFYTYTEIIDLLVPYLKEMGYTT